MNDEAVYEIQIAGRLHDGWSEWFEGDILASEKEDITIIVANLRDQAALYGLLAKVRDLGVVLLSVNRRLG